MNRVLKIAYQVVAVVLAVTVCSCANEAEDLDIKYSSTIEISAAKLFDNFTPYSSTDFDISHHGMTLVCDLLVYDAGGTLCDKSSMKTRDINESLKYERKLNPGDYTLVCVASFEGMDSDSGTEIKYWDISDEQSLSTLSVTERSGMPNTPFETLGLTVEDIKVTDRTFSTLVNIKPVTALISCYVDLSNNPDLLFDNFFHSPSPGASNLYYCFDEVNIYNLNYKNKVIFEGEQPVFKTTQQTNDNIIYTYNDDSDWYWRYLYNGYRAVLPDEDKTVHWSLKLNPNYADRDYMAEILNCVYPLKTEGYLSCPVKAGSQYLMTFALDMLDGDLIPMPYHFDYTDWLYKKNIDIYRDAIDDFLDMNFGSFIDMDIDAINQTLGYEPYYQGVYDDDILADQLFDDYPKYYSSYYGMKYGDIIRSFGIESADENRTETAIVSFSLIPQWNAILNDYLIEALSKRYHLNAQTTLITNPSGFLQEDIPAHIYVFSEKADPAQSKYDIVLTYLYYVDGIFALEKEDDKFTAVTAGIAYYRPGFTSKLLSGNF